MAKPTKTAQLKLLGIWLPPEEKRQIKVAAAAHDMTLNQAVRQAMREWIARSQLGGASTHASSASSSTQVSAPQQGTKPVRQRVSAGATDVGREAASAYAAKLMRQAVAKADKLAATGPRPPAAPAARPQVSTPPREADPQANAPTRKAEPAQAAIAPARSKASFAWLRGAAALDWSACPAVESHAAPDGSRVWVFRGTRVTLKKVFRLLQEGHRSAKLGKRFNLDPQVFEEVLRFAAQRLAPYLPGAR